MNQREDLFCRMSDRRCASDAVREAVGGYGCGCGTDSWGLGGYPLAMVYSPCQSFDNLYDVDTAIKNGTLFIELDKPFEGSKKGGCSC